MTELLTCPFCGGEAEYVYIEWDGAHIIRCKRESANDDCQHVAAVECETEAEAIAAWNSRYHSEFEKTVIKAWKEIKDYTERTCEEYGSVRVWQSCNVWSHELSCGHEVDTLDNEPPNYCPSCGAKVTPKCSETTPKVVEQ